MPVKCAECGYLGIRLLQTRQLVDADETLRKTGGLTQFEPKPMLDKHPICFARVVDFSDEMAPNPDNGQRLHHLQKERQCDDFIDWQPGFSPKEHFEMKLLEEQREASRKAVKEDRDWRAEQERVATYRFWIGLLATIGFTGILVCIATVYSAYIAAGRL